MRGSAVAVAFAGITALVSGCESRAPKGPPETAVPTPGVPPRTTPDVAPARGFSRPGGAAAAAVQVRCDAPTHPISPLVYGTSVQPMRDKPEQWTFGATARRWGGNHTTRYNWELGNAWNTGKDWFYKNVDYDHQKTPAHLRFIDDDVAHGVATALTVPILGWVAKDTTSYSFPVALYGAAQATEPGQGDVGNGVSPSGAQIVPRSAEQTSVAMPPENVGKWVRSLRERDRAHGRRSVQMYILDNEPTLWSETHRDVHPSPVSYDELRDRTLAYATEVRAADPDAWIAGPALWGWPAYFGSGVDKAAAPKHPDRDKHGGVPLLPWWLREIAAHEKKTGLRLLDVVDVHFYPQGKNVGIGTSGGTDPDTSARRIRATRALWDPTYKDESWIAEPIALIPRLKKWIADEHPGLGVSIGEYNFGAETHMSGGLAVAEALGRFGAEGITSAFYWDYPPPGSPAQLAFRAFRDFDGKGGRFLDQSVPTTARAAGVSAFASRDDEGHVVLVLLNLDPQSSLLATTDASSCGNLLEQKTYTYGEGTPGFAARASQIGAERGSVVTPLPPYSMTVLDMHFGKTP